METDGKNNNQKNEQQNIDKPNPQRKIKNMANTRIDKQ